MTASVIQYRKDSDNIVTLILDAPNQSANLLDIHFQTSLSDIVDKIEQETLLAGVVITSAKSTFMAGADLSMILNITQENAEEFMAFVTQFKKVLRRLETLKVPVVAAINGTVLGGGLELCLACHARFVVDDARVQLGLPEVSLGLLPGGGGIVRLTRLLGLEKSAPLLLEGKKLNPQEAKQLGIVHEVISAEELLSRAKSWCLANPHVQQPWDQKDFKIPGGVPSNPKLAQMIAVMPAMLIAKTKGCYPAPEAIMSAAVEGLQMDFESACLIESRYFVQLVTSQVAKNMINTLFFQIQEINRGAGRPAVAEKWIVKKVGLLGAGMMGAGIAYACAVRGIQVILKDTSLEKSEFGKSYSEKLLAKKISRGQMSIAQKDEILARIYPTDMMADLSDCDLVVEAVFEDKKLKAEVSSVAEQQLSENAIFASNTSSLPITGLAEAVTRPKNFIGLHFFSPVDKMPLVEIICGQQTSMETLAKAFDFVQQIKKTPIVVNDNRGFFTTRVIGTYLMEGVGMLEEGIHPASIERAAAKAGFPVGALAIIDELTLSLSQKVSMDTARDLAAEGKLYHLPPGESVLHRMLDEFKRLGKSTGAGFYEYPAQGKKYLWPGLVEHFVKAEVNPPLEDLIERLLFIQTLEALKCFDEGVIESVAYANVGSIMGIGYPAWTGGVMQYLRQYGLSEFIRRCAELAGRYGARFTAPAWLSDVSRRQALLGF